LLGAGVWDGPGGIASDGFAEDCDDEAGLGWHGCMEERRRSIKRIEIVLEEIMESLPATGFPEVCVFLLSIGKCLHL